MFKIVFRDSSLYPKQMSLFCLLWGSAQTWSISRAQSNVTGVQKWLVTAHYRVGLGDSTQSTLRKAKTLLQRPSYNVIHSSSYKNLAVGKKGRHFKSNFEVNS